MYKEPLATLALMEFKVFREQLVSVFKVFREILDYKVKLVFKARLDYKV